MFYEALYFETELEACAEWCSQRADANPVSRQLVIAQDISLRRGKRESLPSIRASRLRATFRVLAWSPLNQTALAGSAHLLLRWLDGLLEESELDWLLASGLSANQAESDELQLLYACSAQTRICSAHSGRCKRS